ncbi:putative signaling protein [Tepidimonas sediminis]|uniref:Putative signaling protein n=1 Tax=Tepidimonas sediminis TaxID=2588941 RepID=A0A554WK08_9BURK|nr:GGDEF domain-containing protein [Tepidimonas sediminis]TSE23885.1 putative signaling protein [Tepidimonas sediminis]
MDVTPAGSDARDAYERELGPQRIRTAREFAVLGATLYALFGILDWWAIPSALHAVWLVRAVVVAWLLGLLALTRWPGFLGHYPAIMVTSFVVVGLGIEVMVLLAGPHDLARWLYYTGLILVVMALYTFTYLPVWILGGVGFGLVVLYLLIAVGAQRMTGPGDAEALLAHAFFFVSANIIGVIAARQRQRLLHEGFWLRQRLRGELQRTVREKELTEWRALRDPLTGLANREALMRQLRARLAAVRQGRGQVVVLFVDLDGFKQVNDQLGHAVGDEVLRIVARRLERCVRDRDLVARLGGDEFAVVLWLEDGGDEAVVQRVAQAIEEAAAQPIVEPDVPLPLGASVGVARHPQDGEEAAQLLRVADARMYEVKARRHQRLGR